VIARCEAKGQVSEAQSESFIALIEGVPIEVDPDTFSPVQREAVPIATLDEDPRRAASEAGVKIFKPT
jgi:hypothetical protein